MFRLLAILLALAAPLSAQSPFPVDIKAEFSLTDHFGNQRSENDFDGRGLLIFFGYANCESICTVALPALGEALALLGDDLNKIQPILITVDPKNDTPAALAKALPTYHPALLGLTGTEEELAQVRAKFQVYVEELFQTPDGQPVYSHGSFVYLTDANGEVVSLLPPILSPERMAEIIRSHL